MALNMHPVVDLLIAEKESLARAITDALYRDMPELYTKYGERGRQKCLQDMRYNLEHLAPAVEMGDPSMFAKYIVWLDGLLRARNVATGELVRCLELTREVLRPKLDPAHADDVMRILDAGLAELNRA